MSIQDFLPFFKILAINLVSIFIFAYFLYYKQHKDYQWFMTYFLFNIFIFLIIYFLWHEDINMTVGFAIFGLVGIVRLRSDTMSKTDIIYFLGALTIAIINALNTWWLIFLIFINILILALTFFADNQFGKKYKYKKMQVILDQIPTTLFTDTKKTTDLLSTQFGIKVLDYEVGFINNIKDSVDMTITWK